MRIWSNEIRWSRLYVTGNLNWRIATPDGGFFTRSAVQNFVQDETQPGILYNHGNEFLNYQDDWFVFISSFDQEFLKSSPFSFYSLVLQQIF